MSILKNKWYWILFALIIIGGIGVTLFTQLNTEPEPEKVFKEPSPEILKNIRDKQTTQEPPVAVEEPQLVGVNEHPPGPHRHADSTVHNPSQEIKVALDRLAVYKGIVLGPKVVSFAKAPAGVDLNWASMAPEELASWIHKIENHQHFPSAEYEYLWDPDPEFEDKIALDINGYPILHTRREPVFLYDPAWGFLPTPEQWKEYQQLKAQCKEAQSEGRTADVKRISDQMGYMRRTYVGEKPDYAVAVEATSREAIEVKQREARRVKKELKAAVYQKVGIGYFDPNNI